MINLLPNEQKRQIRAARSNVLLIRYNFAMVFVIVFLAGAISITSFILTSEKNTAEKSITANQAKIAGFNTIQSEATQFRTSLSKAKGLLDTSIPYAKIITETANLLPSGTALSTFQLDGNSFGKPMVLNIKVKNEDQALALRGAFQSSTLYSNVSYGKLTTSSDSDSGAYPFTIELNVTLNKVVTP